MDLRGFEPLTSSVRLRRAPNCATGPCESELYPKIETPVKLILTQPLFIASILGMVDEEMHPVEVIDLRYACVQVEE
jgi:hypothetical protein